MPHIPVLLKEVIEKLDPQPGQFFIDGTFGQGGHALEIFPRILPTGKLLGVDLDGDNLKKIGLEILAGLPKSAKTKNNLILVQGNYAALPEILKSKKLGKADGLLLDLGFSSIQVEGRGLGFSFRRDEPLLMVYDRNERPVYEWLEILSESEIAEIIQKFSGERYAARIARAIKKNLPIKTTGKLAEIIRSVLPRNYERGRIDPATRTFLALRIFANNELLNLEKTLLALPDLIKPKGRIAVISYNSLEDKIVKNVFKGFYRQGKAVLLTKKPETPDESEIKDNPRARSAKLRAIEFK